MKPATLVVILSFSIFVILTGALIIMILNGVLFSTIIDGHVALEMFKAIIQVDGLLIAFAGVLATLVVAEVKAWAYSMVRTHRVWVLAWTFVSVGCLLVSIISSVAGMSALRDDMSTPSIVFVYPLALLIGGVCWLCVVASGIIIREP